MADVDSSLTLEYNEFVRLMKMEKSLFAEEAFARFNKSGTTVFGVDKIVEVLKGAGYVYTDDWVPFLDQFKKGDGSVDYQSVLRVIR